VGRWATVFELRAWLRTLLQSLTIMVSVQLAALGREVGLALAERQDRRVVLNHAEEVLAAHRHDIVSPVRGRRHGGRRARFGAGAVCATSRPPVTFDWRSRTGRDARAWSRTVGTRQSSVARLPPGRAGVHRRARTGGRAR
jgi:hypothetical protein